jgi:hypothetical protein
MAGATAAGATIGAAVGSLFPVIGTIAGTIIGGAIGIGIDLFNFFSGQSAQQKRDELQAAQDLANNTALLGDTRTSILKTEGLISGYEEFLSHMPVAGEALGESTGDLEFDRNYRALLENYGNLNVIAGATGRVAAGTSMAAVGERAQEDVSDLVDWKTDFLDQQLAIEKATLDSLEDTEAALLKLPGMT